MVQADFKQNIKKIMLWFFGGLMLLFLFLVWAFTSPHVFLPEEVFVKDAKRIAYGELQLNAKHIGLNAKDFKLERISRNCCADGYDYHIIYCHPHYRFSYDSSFNYSGLRALKKGDTCDREATRATQYSPYLGY